MFIDTFNYIIDLDYYALFSFSFTRVLEFKMQNKTV